MDKGFQRSVTTVTTKNAFSRAYSVFQAGRKKRRYCGRRSLGFTKFSYGYSLDSCRLFGRFIVPPQKFRIPCQHFMPLRQVFRAVVCRSHFVLLHMGKLPFYHVWRVAVFVQDVCCQAAEAVRGSNAAVTHAPREVAQRVFAHGLVRVADGGKQIAAVACKGVQLLQQFQRPICQRHDVRGFHFHFFGRYAPPALQSQNLPIPLCEVRPP